MASVEIELDAIGLLEASIAVIAVLAARQLALGVSRYRPAPIAAIEEACGAMMPKGQIPQFA